MNRLADDFGRVIDALLGRPSQQAQQASASHPDALRTPVLDASGCGAHWSAPSGKIATCQWHSANGFHHWAEGYPYPTGSWAYTAGPPFDEMWFDPDPI